MIKIAFCKKKLLNIKKILKKKILIKKNFKKIPSRITYARLIEEWCDHKGEHNHGETVQNH